MGQPERSVEPGWWRTCPPSEGFTKRQMTTTHTIRIAKAGLLRAFSGLIIIFSILPLASCGVNLGRPRDTNVADGSQQKSTKAKTASVQPGTLPPAELFSTGGIYYRNWTKYMTDDDDIKYFCDEGAIIHSPRNTVQVWIKREFPPEAAQREIVTRYEIDCGEARYRTLELRVTYPNGRMGRTDKPTKWVNIYDNSNEEYLRDEYCK